MPTYHIFNSLPYLTPVGDHLFWETTFWKRDYCDYASQYNLYESERMVKCHVLTPLTPSITSIIFRCRHGFIGLQSAIQSHIHRIIPQSIEELYWGQVI